MPLTTFGILTFFFFVGACCWLMVSRPPLFARQAQSMLARMLLLRRSQSRLEHARIGAAAADVAGAGALYIVECGVGVVLQERVDRHHEAGRAEAAHHAIVRNE